MPELKDYILALVSHPEFFGQRKLKTDSVFKIAEILGLTRSQATVIICEMATDKLIFIGGYFEWVSCNPESELKEYDQSLIELSGVMYGFMDKLRADIGLTEFFHRHRE